MKPLIAILLAVILGLSTFSYVQTNKVASLRVKFKDERRLVKQEKKTSNSWRKKFNASEWKNFQQSTAHQGELLERDELWWQAISDTWIGRRPTGDFVRASTDVWNSSEIARDTGYKLKVNYD